jgi:hypothetical protein
VTYFVLDGRNRLEALTRLGVRLPSPANPREFIKLPRGLEDIAFVVANDDCSAPQVHDPAEFVIGANIRRRHLSKEERAELIVKTIAAGRVKINRATVARSFNPTSGKKGGSTKDAVLAQAVTEAQKHGISKRTVQNARAKIQGKTPAPRKPSPATTTSAAPAPSPAPVFSQPPPKGEATPLGTTRPSAAGSPANQSSPSELIAGNGFSHRGDRRGVCEVSDQGEGDV